MDILLLALYPNHSQNGYRTNKKIDENVVHDERFVQLIPAGASGRIIPLIMYSVPLCAPKALHAPWNIPRLTNIPIETK